VVAIFLSQEAANNVQKAAQFYRQIFQTKLFKSSPNAVVSSTGPIASRLPNSYQSTQSLCPAQDFLKNSGVKKFWARNICANFRYQFFMQVERNGLHISAKYHERIPNRQCHGASQIFQFFDGGRL